MVVAAALEPVVAPVAVAAAVGAGVEASPVAAVDAVVVEAPEAARMVVAAGADSRTRPLSVIAPGVPPTRSALRYSLRRETRCSMRGRSR